MNRPHPADLGPGLRRRPVRRPGYELRGTAQTAKHVAAEVRMIPDTGQHTGVEHLEEQR